jgi:signal transduction histidine kinase
MSFRTTRNVGFFILLCIIIALCLLSFRNYKNIYTSLRAVTSYETPVREKTDLIIRILTETKNSFELYILRDKTDKIDVMNHVDLLFKESLKLEHALGDKIYLSDILKQIRVIVNNTDQDVTYPDSDTKSLLIDSAKQKFSDFYKELFSLNQQIYKIDESQRQLLIQQYHKIYRIYRETLNSFDHFRTKRICLNDVIVPLDRVVDECNVLEKIIGDTEKDAVNDLLFNTKQLKQYIFNYVSQEKVLNNSSDTLMRMKSTVLKIREKVQHSLNKLQQKVNIRIGNKHQQMFTIIDRTQLMMIIGMIVGILFAFIAAIVTSRSLMKPISRLVDATRKMATGNLNYRIKEFSKDEIGKIAQALNLMAEKLQNITVSRDTLRETQTQLIQASKLASIGELAAGIAHELNQPLMVIHTGIQMIERSISKKRIDLNSILEDMKLFHRNTKRMMKIINHLRTFSRQSDVDFEPVHINQIIEDALSMITEQLRLRDIHLTKTLHSNLPKINGNGNQLEQVILNLLTNARDAIESNNNNKEIEIKTELAKDESTVNIYIIDSGTGISSDAIEHIFNPFYTTKEVGKGTGLGLSISYGIINDHHGEIFVVETGNSGTTFGISLPVVRK